LGRRRFEHLYLELSVAVGARVPRYALWMSLHDSGSDPEQLEREDVIAFCDGHLDGFLAARGWHLAPRVRTALCRRLARFDPRHPTPEEFMARLGSPGA